MSEKNTIGRDRAAGNPAPKRAKRTYLKPVLIQHGNLREITLHVGNTGKGDSSPHSNNHYFTG